MTRCFLGAGAAALPLAGSFGNPEPAGSVSPGVHTTDPNRRPA